MHILNPLILHKPLGKSLRLPRDTDTIFMLKTRVCGHLSKHRQQTFLAPLIFWLQSRSLLSLKSDAHHADRSSCVFMSLLINRYSLLQKQVL